MEGSIHTFPAGPRIAVHIIIHIIESATGESIYVETFEGPIRRLAGIMDEVTESVYGALSAMIEMPPEPIPQTGPTQSRAALALHNRSARVLNQGLSHQRLDETIRLLDHACRIDPGFISAKRFLMTAIAVRVLTLTSPDDQEDIAVMARLSETLFAVDTPSARLSCCLGLMYLASRDFGKAKTCFTDALTQEPGALDAPIYLAWAQVLNNETIESVASVEACLHQSDSLSRNAIARHVIALHHLQNGELKAAQELAETAVEEFNPFHMNWLLLALSFALQGKTQQASSTFFKARRVIGPHDEAMVVAWVEHAAASAKRAHQWRSAFDNCWKA
jgi:tetratricopeptide (TPR) repeat protein